jgi:hypothetical protein
MVLTIKRINYFYAIKVADIQNKIKKIRVKILTNSILALIFLLFSIAFYFPIQKISFLTLMEF